MKELSNEASLAIHTLADLAIKSPNGDDVIVSISGHCGSLSVQVYLGGYELHASPDLYSYETFEEAPKVLQKVKALLSEDGRRERMAIVSGENLEKARLIFEAAKQRMEQLQTA